MQTMDLSYDFLSACGDEYEEFEKIIATIHFDDEVDALAFFITESKAKYTKSELYLLDRLEYHVNAMAQRYEQNVDVKKVDFENPLLRK